MERFTHDEAAVPAITLRPPVVQSLWPPAPLSLALFAAAICLALWLPTLALLPAWHDEVITLLAIDEPTLDLIGNRLKNAHSPVYFVLLQWWQELTGDSLFLVRLPSALGAAFGAACLSLVVYRLSGARAGGWRAAVVLAPLFACSPILLAEAQDARPYGLLFGFLGLFACSTASLVDHPRLASRAWPRNGARSVRQLRLAWYGASIGALGLMAMLPLGSFAVLAGDAAVLWTGRRGPRRRLLRRWFRLRVLTLILLAPLIYGLATFVGRRAGNFWPPELSWGVLEAMFTFTYGGRVYWGDLNHFLGVAGGQALAWGLCLSMVLGLILAQRRPSLSVVVALALLPQLLLIAISLHTSLMVARYFAIATPILVAFAALGLGGLWRRSPLVAAALGATVLTLLFLQSLDAMQRSGKPRFDLAVAKLRDAGTERLGVNVRDQHLALSVLYNLRDGPKAVLLPTWAVIHAAKQGVVVWVIGNRRPSMVWESMAEHNALAACRPVLPGVKVLALAARPEDLASSCAADTPP